MLNFYKSLSATRGLIKIVKTSGVEILIKPLDVPGIVIISEINDCKLEIRYVT